MICFSRAIFVGVMEAMIKVVLVYWGVVVVGVVGMASAGLVRKCIGTEIWEAMLVRFKVVTRPLMEAMGMADEEDVERGHG